ncbi:MAG: hypothetical protein IKG80_02005, partial [Clostridia bacterium]|nr:hypothetical protein [Clostridia bacterium]
MQREKIGIFVPGLSRPHELIRAVKVFVGISCRRTKTIIAEESKIVKIRYFIDQSAYVNFLDTVGE